MIMKKIKEINDKIKKLFDYTSDYTSFPKNELLVPWFYNPDMFDKNAEILFVWMNPAWYLKDFYLRSKRYKHINKTGIRKDIESESYKWEEKPYIYYKSLIDLFPGTNGIYNWNHIDLFQFRGTQQWKVTKAINNHKKFFDAQYKITRKLINILKPKIIVVISAEASKFLKEKWYWNKYKEIWKKWYWDPSEGVFEERCPVLFTWMLSWQRALDVWTRDMLKYHIDKILKSIKKEEINNILP